MALRDRFRLTIGKKMVGLITVLLLSSVAGFLLLSTQIYIERTTVLIQEKNLESALNLTSIVRRHLESLTDKMRILGTVLIQPYNDVKAKDQMIADFFSNDKDLYGLYVHQFPAGGAPGVQTRAFAPHMGMIADADGEKALAALANEPDFSFAHVSKGEQLITAIQLADLSPALVVSIPFVLSQKANPQDSDHYSHILTAILKPSFWKAFEGDTDTRFMVDRKGRLLAHTDTTRVTARENLAHLDIVKQLIEGKSPNGQTQYFDGTEERLGAFYAVGFAGLGVVADVSKSKVFEGIQQLANRSALVAAIIFFVSLLMGFLYSRSITWPIKQLESAAKRISEGDFKIVLKAKGRDEVAQLSRTFNEMAKGLEERDRVKSTFNKFHNKEVAEKLLSGEVKLGGERKEATIFFSDVRGFTAMSESMAPEQVVEMLNEYMTRMVAIIRANGGIVDKYVGDAIMALWGVPISHDGDSVNAVKACVEMRQALAELNELRISRGQPVLKIGMGLNCGEVIAGNIGSEEKMEYTVIGDSVNLASRIESMTKEYGTDLLISRSIHEKVKDRFVIEACKTAKVKGKSTAIEVFKVKGFISEAGEQILVETPYSSYAAEKSDKVMHEPEPSKTDIPAKAQFTPPPVPAVEAPGSAPEFTLEPNDISSPEIVREENTASGLIDQESDVAIDLNATAPVLETPVLEESMEVTPICIEVRSEASQPTPPPFRGAELTPPPLPGKKRAA